MWNIRGTVCRQESKLAGRRQYILCWLFVASTLLALPTWIIHIYTLRSEERAMFKMYVSSHQAVNAQWNIPNVNPWCAAALDRQQTCFLPVVVFAHNRAHYLKQTLESLHRACLSGPTKAVVIISVDADGSHHSVLDTATRFMKAHTNSEDNNGCVAAKVLIYPSRLGSNRSGWSILALKQHWWAALSDVFGAMRNSAFAGYASDVLFVEEDISLSPDALEVARDFSDLKKSGTALVEGVWAFGLSVWAAPTGNANSRQFVVMFGHTNLVYGFNLSTWSMLENARSHFNAFEDGWDWSIYHMQQVGCLPEAVIAPELPRFRHIGVSGLTTTEESYKKAGFLRFNVSTLSGADYVAQGGMRSGVSSREAGKHPAKVFCRGCEATEPQLQCAICKATRAHCHAE